jgi:hypothetical protein
MSRQRQGGLAQGILGVICENTTDGGSGSAEQVEEGTREAPIEGAVHLGMVVTPQMETVASMADVPRLSMAAASWEKMA